MNIVINETKKLILPTIILSAVTFFVFGVFGYFNLNIFVTIIFSSAYSLVNYFLIGASIAVALSKSSGKAQFYMTSQYIVRYIIAGTIIYYSLIISEINTLAVVIPMFFPKIILISSQIKK